MAKRVGPNAALSEPLRKCRQSGWYPNRLLEVDVVDLSKMTTSFALGEEVSIGLVKQLFDEWGKGNFVGSAKSLLSQDVVWKTPWAPDCVGKAACLSRLEQMASRISRVEVEWLSFVNGKPLSAAGASQARAFSDGIVVLGERRDTYERADGSAFTIECSGAMLVRGAEIVYWRDYFDPRPFLDSDGTWPPLR